MNALENLVFNYFQKFKSLFFLLWGPLNNSNIDAVFDYPDTELGKKSITHTGLVEEVHK